MKLGQELTYSQIESIAHYLYLHCEVRENQLKQLMQVVSETAPHFIRCIKPNPRNLPDLFEPNSVTEQLRYGGVLQAIQIARAGFPVRPLHDEFVRDYAVLLLGSGRGRRLRDIVRLGSHRARAEQLLTSIDSAFGLPRIPGGQRASAAIGNSRVFLKQQVHDALCHLRFLVRGKSAQRIQAKWRSYFFRTRVYLPAVRKAPGAQAVVRAAMVRRFFLRWLASRRIQSYWRMRTQFKRWNAEIVKRAKSAEKSAVNWKGLIPASALQSQNERRGISAFARSQSLGDAPDVQRLMGDFQDRKEQFMRNIEKENDELSSDHFSKRMQDLHSELEQAKRALNQVEEQINLGAPVTTGRQRTVVVGAPKAPQLRVNPSHCDYPAEPRRNLIAAAQARSDRFDSDKLAQEEAEMKKLIGRIQSELAKPAQQRK